MVHPTSPTLAAIRVVSGTVSGALPKTFSRPAGTGDGGPDTFLRARARALACARVLRRRDYGFGGNMKKSALLLVAAATLGAQGIEYVKANYTKYEYRIAMRDGVKLFTSVYVPKDTSQPWPIMFDRTPYSVAPYGEDNYKTSLGPSDLFAKDKFIFVYQDVRGRQMSEGQFMDMRPQKNGHNGVNDVAESTDTYDSIDWLVENHLHNHGKIGMRGISYPGFYTAAALIDAHPALVAASPQAPITDWFMGDDFHHNGAL